MNARTQEVATEVQRRRGVASTEYSVTGTIDGVCDAIKEMFANFPADGYGTHVHAISSPSAGVYVARISHSNTCD